MSAYASQESPKFLEWTYQSQHPFRTLWRWANFGAGRLVRVLCLFLLKNSPVWLMPLTFSLLLDKVTRPESVSNSQVVLMGVAVFASLLCNVPFHTLFITQISNVTRDLERRLRRALVIRLQQLSIPYHDDTESGHLQSKVLRDVEQVHMIAQQLAEQGITMLLTFVIALGITLYKKPSMVLIYLAVAPLVLFLRQIFNNPIRRENRAFRQKIEEMNSQVSQMIEMIPVSRAHGIESTATRRVDLHLDQIREQGGRLDRVNALFMSATFVAIMIGNVTLFMISSWLCYQGRISVGEVVLFDQLFRQLLMSLNQALGFYPQIARGFESVRSIGEVLECPDLEYNQGKAQVSEVRGEIVYEHLGYSYRGADHPALEGVHLHIAPGECVAVVGPSGGGKSTLMRLTIGFRRATAGRILLDGRDMEEIDMRSWRRFISVVPQETMLFEGSIRENICFGSPHIDEEVFQHILDAANVREFVEQMPEGLNTRVGEGGARLSGGQRQRLAIARALVRDPKVIVLDEPTSALDVVSERLVQEAIDRLIKDRTTLIVAHRLSTIRNADRIVVMEEGRIVETGTYAELAAKPGGAFARMKELQG